MICMWVSPYISLDIFYLMALISTI
jgi:hypothetical protein